jgi:hypothetical protein
LNKLKGKDETMRNQDIAQRRLHTQHLAGAPLTTAAEVVAWLGAVQAQDYTGALWSVGLRTQGATAAAVEQAIANRQIVRTWPMRGTLHFVAPADVRWMLKLLTPRVIANSARRYAQLGLDTATFAQAEQVFITALQGGQQLTRQAMMAALEKAGIATAGQRGYHLLGWAAQLGLICFGPMQGKQPTFVLLDEWIPPGNELTRDESLAAVALRYFTSHGPATLQDFMWWTGLVAADARAGLEMVKAQLTQATRNGQRYWLPQSLPHGSTKSPVCHLLPGFDEYLLGYTDRSALLDPIYNQRIQPGKNGVFSPTLVIDGQVVGTWKRTVKKGIVMVALTPFMAFSPDQQQAIAVAAERYGRFLGLTATVVR